jgi:hypothetical protein
VKAILEVIIQVWCPKDSLDMRARLVMLLGMSVVVAQAEDDPTGLLRRVSQKVMDTVNRLPKYVCTLSIDRAEYENNGVFQTRACDALASEKRAGLVKRRLSRWDRLRLDVAIGTSHVLPMKSGFASNWLTLGPDSSNGPP